MGPATKGRHVVSQQASEKGELRIAGKTERLTHYLFRYPAKFHPPVARTLLKTYSGPNDVVLDPFSGSGTLLEEAAVLGRRSIGVDVDPVAVAVAQSKVHRYRISTLRASGDRLLERLRRYDRGADFYRRIKLTDIPKTAYERELDTVSGWVPDIPNIEHWFRRYVVVDLARIRRSISLSSAPQAEGVINSRLPSRPAAM